MSLRSVLVVDDHRLFRAALVRLLETTFGSPTQVQAVSTGAEALEIARTLPSIEVILLDIQMPGLSGIEVLSRLRKQGFAGGVLMISQFDAPSLIEYALNKGANGFLLKNCDPDDLFAAIRTAAEGKFFDNELAQEWKKQRPPSQSYQGHHLSPREADLLNHLRRGKSTKEIAKALSLSPLTIESYRKKLMIRAKAKNVAELVNWAFEMGFVNCYSNSSPRAIS